MNRLDEVRKSVDRDARRLARRERGHGSFWRSLSVLGAIGWPIVLLSSGGAMLGHWLDLHVESGKSLTVALLVAGALAGSAVAWQVVRGTKP